MTLHIKKDAKEFLEEPRIRHIIKTYSDHIGFPVKLGDETLNEASAIWTRQPKEINEEQHKEFYHHIAHAFDEPWMTIHNRVEGVVSYINLLYVPSTQPFDLFEPERKGHVKLYVNRVFITDDTSGLLPTWLRFLRGVVDSEDLTLNISREMLQTDPKLAKIRTGLTKKVLTEIKKKAEKKPEEYATFWSNFGAVVKEGLIEDATLRDRTRHQFKRRTFYLDEDSWSIAVVDCYDNRDELWKVQEAFLLTLPFIPTVTGSPEAIYDLQSGRYFLTAMTNEDEVSDFEIEYRDTYFQVSNLKRLARKR